MHYIYLLKSESHPTKQYVGLTRDLRQRLKAHNESRSPHTAKSRPWHLIAYFAFADEQTDLAFEKYLNRVRDAHSLIGTFFRAINVSLAKICRTPLA
jgi:putative endonuclease